MNPNTGAITVRMMKILREYHNTLPPINRFITPPLIHKSDPRKPMNTMDEPDQPSSAPTEPDDQPPSSSPPSHPASIQVEIIDTLTLLDAHALQQLTNLANQALALLPNSGQVRVCIVDDQRMSDAHAKFSSIAGTTDVLTFDLADQHFTNAEHKVLDTDLTICFDEASRQASTRSHTVEQELLLYIIHGTLHCLGYNDHEEKEYQRMHHKEDELLRAIGLGDTFFTPQHTNDTINNTSNNTINKEHKS